MVAFFLGKHGIRGVEIPYASQFNGIFADIRFTIAVEPTYFRKFADKLISSLFEVEFQFREIDAKLWFVDEIVLIYFWVDTILRYIGIVNLLNEMYFGRV